MGWFGWREGVTRGVLVAGRAYDGSELTRAQVVVFCEAVDVIAKRCGPSIVAVPVDADLSDGSGADEDQAFCSVLVGMLAAQGGTHEPLLVTREAMVSALDRARAIPDAVWEELSSAHRDAGGEPSDDDVALRLGSVGELAEAKLAFGRLGPRDAALGGAYIYGQAPDTTPHAVGVHGIRVAGSSYDTSADPIDIDDAAHEARVAESPRGGYYLIAQHD